MWQVILTKIPKINDFPADFFPRRVAYKKDAMIYKKEVEAKGGEAKIERVKK